MQKLLKISVALALMISFANITLAEDFDPIADLSNYDALLGLDLPTDFEDLDPLEIPAEIDEPETLPTNETETTTTPTITTTIGSGGAIENEVEATNQNLATTTPSQNFYTPTPSQFFNSEIGSTSIADASYNYSSYSAARSQLTPTGPAATLAFAVLAAIGLAWIFRKKIVNV